MLTFSHEFFFQNFYMDLYEIAWIYTMVKCKSFIVTITCPKLDIYIYTDVNEKFYTYTSVSKFQIFIYTYTKDMFKTIYTHTQH